MFTNRKIQLIGMTLLIAAAVLVTLSATRPPAPGFVPVTGSNLESLAQYHRSEWGAPAAQQNSLNAYYLSERTQTSSAISREADLTQYFRSERGAAAQDGLAIYHQSEWSGK
jgi:hypothetical protein